MQQTEPKATSRTPEFAGTRNRPLTTLEDAMTAYRLSETAESMRRIAYSAVAGFVAVFILFVVTR